MATFRYVGLETDNNVIVGKDCVQPWDIIGAEAPAYGVNWHFQVRGIPASDADMYPRNLCDGPNIWFNPSLTASRTDNHCTNVTSGRWPLYAIRSQETNGTYTWDLYVAPSDWPAEPQYPPIGTVYTVELYKGTQELNEMVPPDLTLTTIVTSNQVPPIHEGPGDSCALGGAISHIGNDQQAGAAPLSLLRGEKREAVTDLSLNTPAGALAFTRSYRQEQQANDPIMGLGWTHNHAMFIDDSVTNKLIVQQGNGGRAHFTYKSGLDLYEGDAGSTATIAVDSGSTDARYTLTTADDVQYVFDDQERLRERQWPNGEIWTYSYYTSGFATGYLQEVADGYGRKLQFTYVDNSGQFDHLQLWRVGDQDATGLDGGSPAGNYVEFTYIQEYEDGTPVSSNPQPLLSEAQDVRGNTWIYRYYGYESGEDVSDLFNTLVRIISPTVDVDGDGSPDGTITRKSLSYSFTQELAVNGGMEADSDWTAISGAEPNTNQQSTSQVDSGTYARYVEADAADEGIEGTPWALVAGRTYTITARVYPVNSGDQVKMQVTGTTALDDTSTGDGAWETLTATYTPTVTTSGRRLQFIAVGGAADFYVDSVSIEERYPDHPAQITEQLGLFGTDPALLTMDYVFQPSAQAVTTETIAGLTTTHHFPGGVYAGVEDPAGNRREEGLDVQYRPVLQIDANEQATAFEWSADGTQLESVTNAKDETTTFTYLTDGSHRLETVEDAQGHETTYTYGDSNNPRLPTRIQVYDTDGTTVLRWQTLSYDSQGRTLTERLIDPADGTTILRETSRTYYGSGDGNGLLHTMTQKDMGSANDVVTTYTYDRAGRIIQTQQSSNFGSCEISYTVYDAAGNVVATICNYDPGMGAAPTNAAEAAALYDDQAPNKNQVTTHVYDALGRRVQTTLNAGASFAQTHVTLYDALDRVVRTITNFMEDSYAAPGGWVFENGVWKDGPSGTTIAHGTDNTENLIADTAYNARGLVRLQRDTLGRVTLLGYDTAGRLVKSVQNASAASYNNDYSGTAPDPDLSAYTPVADSDQDIIIEQVYDANGNIVQTIDPLGMNTFTVYDALNRPVKVVRSAKDAATLALNPGDEGYDDENDPRSVDYEPSLDPDRDLIDLTEYDALGRVIRTQRLLDNPGGVAVWNTTLYGYDSLGRQVKVVRSASNANYDLAADPDLSGYTASNAVDEDLISQTAYDDNERTLYTQDVLDKRTWFGYDGLGRQIKTVASAVGTATDGGVNDPRSPSYVASSEPDEDLITRTIYNSDGRVEETEDVLGKRTYLVYDTLGRQVRTIVNYIAQGASDPADWEWVSGQWEDGASNTIDHGSANDQNLIADTVYDSQGRVASTFDQLHNETRYSYDVLGRRIQTIQNYMDGVYSGAAPDEDLIVTTAYTLDGQVLATTDSAGNETRYQYDGLGRRIKTIQNYADGVFSAMIPDEDVSSTTVYNKVGQVVATSDNASRETRYTYDALGRRVQTIQNYVNGVFDPATPDEDVVSTTVYNKAGQVVATIDTRGTQTAITYDAAGRRLTTTLAANTYLKTTSYTCYDKAGRVLRTIQNWQPGPSDPSPDEQIGGVWQFAPTAHGRENDQNLITEYAYDLIGRRISVTDPAGNVTTTTYFADGQVDTITDPENADMAYRYDNVRRRIVVVQNWVDNGEDPADWVWDGVTDSRWEESDGTAVVHGANQDQNIIVRVAYDLAGRMEILRDPRGNLTQYAYDRLGRRTKLTNPLSQEWETVYAILVGGGTQTTLTDPNGVNTQRALDRLGRLSSIQYGDPGNTPDVAFSYDAAGNRTAMTEYSGAGFTSPVRETIYDYDDLNRLTSVGFDNDGDSNVDETVSYKYDAAGLRTRLTLPGGTDSIQYLYDERGQLVQLTDWNGQITDFFYDGVGRHRATKRPNRLVTSYRHDAAGRLLRLRHSLGGRTRADFQYVVDGRGNRTQAYEYLPEPSTLGTIYSNPTATQGTWTVNGSYRETSETDARLSITFPNSTDEIVLTYGVNDDHSIFDVYINQTLWQSLDGYAASAGERTVTIPLMPRASGSHVLEIRNRPEHNAASSGYVAQFKQIQVLTTTYMNQTIQYTYDNLSRLIEADYDSGSTVYTYGYDLAGNLVNMDGVTRTFNAANQMTHDGTNTLTYDNNGNLTADGVNDYTWDRANRLLEVDTGTPAELTAYAYDGVGSRISQAIGTSSPVVIQYLLDTQPGLAKVLAATTGGNTDRYVHGPRGIHAMENNSGNWTWAVQDAQGSVRGEVDNTLAVLGIQHPDPYGNLFGQQGSIGLPFAYTGEWRDWIGIQHHRARYYNPAMGGWMSLDPFEGMAGRPMSLNGYSWVEGQVINAVDPSGLCILKEICLLLLPGPLRCWCFNICEPAPTYEELWASGCIPAGTHTPTPTTAFTVYLGGSDTDKGITARTDRPFAVRQAPVWAAIASDTIPYPGAKQLHAEDALLGVPRNSDLIVIGYSAGGDSAVIFSDLYLEQKQANQISGRLVGVGILGPTLDGSTTSPSGNLRTPINGIPQWEEILNRVLATGTRVLVLDDEFEPGFESSKPNWSDFNPQNTNYCYVRRSDRKHYVPPSGSEIGTNNDPELATSVKNFLLGIGSCPSSVH